MNIVINTQLLLYGKLDGIGWFTYETVRRITAAHPEHRFFLIFDRKPAPEIVFEKNTRIIVLHPPSRHPILWFLRFEIFMPFLLWWLRADIFLSPDGCMTTLTRAKGVQVIHDINFAHNPADVPFWARIYYNRLLPWYARRAARIATVSKYSKDDIVSTWNIAASKIDVTPNGCNEYYRPATPEEKTSTRQTYTNGNPFFLYVGALIPRKNVGRMLQAFDRFKETDTTNTRFVIVGNRMWGDETVHEIWEKMKHRDDVIFVGRKDIAELRHLYAASTALVFVPYFEGFGIPILEAFACQTAVITSNVTSMPEVAGDAAMLVDPRNEEEITRAMQEIAADEILKDELIKKGSKRSEQFSWDKTAQALWNTIIKASEASK